MENLSKTFAWTGMIALFAWSMPIMRINAETLPNLAQELQAITSIAENSPLLKHANIEASSVAPVTPNTSNPVALKESELTATSSDLRNEKNEVTKPLLEQIKIPTRLNTETEITQASHGENDANKLEQGIAAFKQSDFETARAMLGKLAEQHHPEAQALYAEMLWNGWGGESNAVLAERYFRQAAAMGNERAINFLPILNNRLIHSNAITRLTTSIEVNPYKEHLSICKKHADMALNFFTEKRTLTSMSSLQYQQKYLKMVLERNTHERCYQQYLLNINNDLAMAKIFPSELHASMTPDEIKRASLNLKQAYQVLKEDAETHFKEYKTQYEIQRLAQQQDGTNQKHKSQEELLQNLHFQNEQREASKLRSSANNSERLYEIYDQKKITPINPQKN